jgi:hypothetical protein
LRCSPCETAATKPEGDRAMTAPVEEDHGLAAGDGRAALLHSKQRLALARGSARPERMILLRRNHEACRG